MPRIVIEALTPLDRTSRIKLYKNNARSRLFCRIAKRSIIEMKGISRGWTWLVSDQGAPKTVFFRALHALCFSTDYMNVNLDL